MVRFLAFVCLWGAAAATCAQTKPPDRATKVRNDKKEVEAEGAWIYNDLPKGIARAKATGKPLLAVFRCIPCEACAQLDEQVVERDPAVRALLDKFVGVRIVHANGMDLDLFQYDYDQSWAAFFLNADLTIYGRYGTRSHQTKSEDDVSLEGFSKALEGALALHAEFPANKPALLAKHGPPPPVKSPEELPALKDKYGSKIDYEGQVVQSCIHCHQVGEGLRQVHRDAGGPIPDKALYPYPNPKILGLVLDPKEKAKIKSVTPASSGAKDGFKPGDELVSLAGQPLLSIADVQWVLHHAGDAMELPCQVLRDGKQQSLKITLAPGWRQRDDIAWRASSWGLRRMTTGGMKLEDISAEDRTKAGLDAQALALRVKHVGQFGPHALAKQAGFQAGDVIVAVDGKPDYLSESSIMTTLVNAKRPGDKVQLTVLRDSKKKDLILPMQ